MGVGPTESECTDTAKPLLLAAQPGSRLRSNLNRGASPIKLRIHRVEVELRRNLFLVQSQHDLQQSGDSGGGLQVPKVRLHRPDHQWIVGGAPNA